MRNTFKISMIVLTLALFAMPSAYAWEGHHHDRWHSSFGVNLSFWPDRYYYHDYVYYPREYVIEEPPVYYQPVYQPVTVVQPAPVQQVAPAPAPVNAETENSFTVNIPNDQGGYTVVTLKRSGNGFVGPQGEFYSEFPRIAQLKAMYAK